jgi:hypothetical protein
MNKDNTKMWSVTKLYNNTSFPDDESSLGYPVNVYQESINKTFKEYLVNFDFLTREMENYGFVPISDTEANNLGFPSAIGSFEALFDIMEENLHNNKIKRKNIGKASNMTIKEKQISFLNNYFIYKKVRNPNAREITNTKLNISRHQEDLDDDSTKKLGETKTQTRIKKRIVKKYKKKLTLPK